MVAAVFTESSLSLVQLEQMSVAAGLEAPEHGARRSPHPEGAAAKVTAP